MGRAKKQGKRYPGGKLMAEKVDPTPEQKARRKFVANGGDENLTGYPLGMALVNDCIDQRQHRAGCEYGELYRKVFGKTDIPITSYAMPKGKKNISDKEFQESWDKLIPAMTALDRSGHGVRKQVDFVCVLNKTPDWMRPPPNLGSYANYGKFKRGLSILAKMFGH